MPVAGKPIVLRQLELAARYGVRDVAVLAGHLADLLKQKMLSEIDKLGLNVEFFVEEKPLGTAGGLKAAGVPLLNLEVDCVDPRNFSQGQLMTRLEAFIEMIVSLRGS